MAIVPAPASAAPIGDYSCDITTLRVNEELDNGSSGPFTAAGSAECWTGDVNQKVTTALSASGTYRAQKCHLINPVIPSYLTLTGTITLTPSGDSAVSTGVTITTADVGTASTGPGTISLGSGQTGYVTARYTNYLLGFVARCGGDGFSPVYSGTFLKL
ncbi:MAG: hypothetical protein M3340_14705 [Actinomycetota bacterium]|nr:hypothetical protein [Actinomycetota bacterium]